MVRILVVEDDEHLGRSIKRGLGAEGFATDLAHNGVDGLWRAREGDYDVVVLDIMLPGLNGLDVARLLRRGDDTGIIMLTAREAVDDRVAGLDVGADDYVTKPFAFKELIARVRAVLRRRGRNLERMLAFQDVTLDRETRAVMRGARPIELTPREFELLTLFLMHPRQVLTRDIILAHIWGYDYEGDDNVIEVYVRHLREKLDDNPPKLLRTVRGVGYVLRG